MEHPENLEELLEYGYSPSFYVMKPLSGLYRAILDTDFNDGNNKVLCIITDLKVKFNTDHGSAAYKLILQSFADRIGRKFFEGNMKDTTIRTILNGDARGTPNWRVKRVKKDVEGSPMTYARSTGMGGLDDI